MYLPRFWLWELVLDLKHLTSNQGKLPYTGFFRTMKFSRISRISIEFVKFYSWIYYYCWSCLDNMVLQIIHYTPGFVKIKMRIFNCKAFRKNIMARKKPVYSNLSQLRKIPDPKRTKHQAERHQALQKNLYLIICTGGVYVMYIYWMICVSYVEYCKSVAHLQRHAYM